MSRRGSSGLLIKLPCGGWRWDNSRRRPKDSSQDVPTLDFSDAVRPWQLGRAVDLAGQQHGGMSRGIQQPAPRESPCGKGSPPCEPGLGSRVPGSFWPFTRRRSGSRCSSRWCSRPARTFWTQTARVHVQLGDLTTVSYYDPMSLFIYKKVKVTTATSGARTDFTHVAC